MGLPDKPKRAFDHVLTNPIIDPVGGTDRSAKVAYLPYLAACLCIRRHGGTPFYCRAARSKADGRLWFKTAVPTPRTAVGKGLTVCPINAQRVCRVPDIPSVFFATETGKADGPNRFDPPCI